MFAVLCNFSIGARVLLRVCAWQSWSSPEDAKSKLAREHEEGEEWREGEDGSVTETDEGGQAGEEARKSAEEAAARVTAGEEIAAEDHAAVAPDHAEHAEDAHVVAAEDEVEVEAAEEEEQGEEDETEAPLALAMAATNNAVAAAANGAVAHTNVNALAPTVANPALAIEPYTGAAAAAMPVYRDITELLNMPQSAAAQILGIPMSTLSKRWKEAVRIRKWPYRQVAKLDKEIMTLLHNIPARNEGDAAATPTPPEIEQALGVLLRRRQEELKPVRIRMN